MVSFENFKSPVLGTVSKSVRQEQSESNIPIKNRKVN